MIDVLIKKKLKTLILFVGMVEKEELDINKSF